MIFLHIPKSAGTSLRRAIWQADGRHYAFVELYDDKPGKTHDDALKKTINGAPLFYGHTHFGIHNRLDVAPVYGTIFRDPIERVISWYRHQRRESGLSFHERIQEGLSLSDMLQANMTLEISNHVTFIISGKPIESPNDREALELAKSNMQKFFAYVGICEWFDIDVPRLAKLLGLCHLPTLHLNAGPRLADDIPDDVKKLVAEYNQLDIELYEFAQGLAEAQRASWDPRPLY
jgi:hypothetical protein